MVLFNKRHKAFIEEMQSGIKKSEANIATHCDTLKDTDHDELMAELERKFDELFGTDNY